MNTQPERYRSLVISFFYASRRLTITDAWRNEKRILTFRKDDEASLSYDQLDFATEYLQSIGIPVVAITNGNRDHYCVALTTNFETSIKGPRGWKRKLKTKIKPKPRST